MRHGFTLVEVLVASVVGVLLLGAVSMFAVLGVRLWTSGAEKVEVDQSALLALHAYETLLEASDVNSVYLNPTGVTAGISFLSGMGLTGRLQYVVSTPQPLGASTPGTSPSPGSHGPGMVDDGMVLWQSRQVLYLQPADNTLRLANIPVAPPSLSPQPYRTAAYTPSPLDHLVAANIVLVQVSDAPLTLTNHTLNPTPTQNPIYVSVTAQKAGLPYTATLSTAIVLDNGLIGGAPDAPTP
jgi:prepilin-type N-terminal cleavage/methylation domain-containing protein